MLTSWPFPETSWQPIWFHNPNPGGSQTPHHIELNTNWPLTFPFCWALDFLVDTIPYAKAFTFSHIVSFLSFPTSLSFCPGLLRDLSQRTWFTLLRLCKSQLLPRSGATHTQPNSWYVWNGFTRLDRQNTMRRERSDWLTRTKSQIGACHPLHQCSLYDVLGGKSSSVTEKAMPLLWSVFIYRQLQIWKLILRPSSLQLLWNSRARSVG